MVITVTTRPVRLHAAQWHKPGDCLELVGPKVIHSFRLKGFVEWGCHNMRDGLQMLKPGWWIVVGEDGSTWPRTYSPEGFAAKFSIVEGQP